ncbi:MAG: hypothetical protein Q9215_001836 [Flavoplaca cf. flavocitrina]
MSVGSVVSLDSSFASSELPSGIPSLTYRIDYEKTMAKLGKAIPAVSTIHTQDRNADVERLSKPGPLVIEDLVDLRPSDLKRILYAREKHRAAMQSQERSRDPYSY